MNAVVEKLNKLPPQVALSAQQAADLEKHLDAFPQAVVEARKLQDMPEGRWPIKYDGASVIKPSTVSLLDALNIARLLALDTMRRAHAADAEGALQSCLAIHNVGQSMRNDPTLMAYLIRQAATAIAVRAMERILAQERLDLATEPSLRRLQDALAKEIPEQAFLEAMRAERAFGHAVFQMIADGKIDAKKVVSVGGSIPFSDVIETAMIEHMPGYLTRQHAMRLRLYTELVESLKMPAGERAKQLETLENKAKDKPLLVRQGLSYLLGQMNEGRRTQAGLRCAVAALAAERYRIAKNRWPESLDVLVSAGFLDAVPEDPYGGKRLLFRRTVDGLVVYSLGPDLADNGGNLNRERPHDSGTDIGFRLWDVTRRRQGG
jgi:hypothetical protein